MFEGIALLVGLQRITLAVPIRLYQIVSVSL